jgi:transcription termination factor Rho
MSTSKGARPKDEERPRSQDPERRNVSDEVVSQLDSLPELDDENEPLSLAEEIAEEADRGEEANDRYERIKQGEIHIAELQKMSMTDLIEEARKENVSDVSGMKKQDLIFKILKERVKLNGLMYGE